MPIENRWKLLCLGCLPIKTSAHNFSMVHSSIIRQSWAMIQVCIISYGVWDTSQVAKRPQNTICHEWRRLHWDWLFSWRLKICYQICSLLDFLDSCEHHLCSWDVLLGVLKIDPQSVFAPCYTWNQTQCIIIFSDTFEGMFGFWTTVIIV